MKSKSHLNLYSVVGLSAIVILCVGGLHAQTPNAYGYSTGYGNVYGSFGLASTMQSIYNVSRAQMKKATARNAMVQKWGSTAVEKAENETAARSASGSKTAPSNPQIVVKPPVVRNHGFVDFCSRDIPRKNRTPMPDARELQKARGRSDPTGS